MSGRKRVGVLISGRGSNMQALIEACRAPDYPAEIALVISNRPGAGGLKLARDAGITAATIDHKAFADRAAFEVDLHRALVEAGVDIVCNAGFMRILTEKFVSQWQGRLLNIHPSLLPAFKGLHIHQRVLQAGAKMTGCTVHFVSPEMDSGAIIAQAAVPVLEGDTPDTLAKRVLAAEHRLYPSVLARVAEGKVELIDDRAVLRDVSYVVPPSAALFSPPLDLS